METTIKEIEQNLKSLPEEFLGQVNDFIEYLKFKTSKAKLENDWANNLTGFQKKSIERGIEDIKNGNTYSHEEAKQKIKEYLLEK